MILGANHRPLPPSEIVTRLQQVDPRLGLRWAEGCFWSEKQQRMMDSWAITERWPLDDRRHRMVQDGLLPADECADVICYLPADCGVDEAFGYFARTCQRNRGKESVQKMLDRVHAFNAKVKEENLRPTTELSEELIGTSKVRIRSDAVGKHKRETEHQKAMKLLEYLDQ